MNALQLTETKKYNNFKLALVNSSPDDVICFKEGAYESIKLEGINGGNNSLTIKADTNSNVIILNRNYHGTGVLIKDSKNIVLSGLTISGGLYGVYSIASTNVTVNKSNIFNVGQEAIIIKSSTSKKKVINIAVSNNSISDTGKLNVEFGEGIWLWG